MGRKLLKTVQTITTFRNTLADPVGTRRGPPLVPSLKTPVLNHSDLIEVYRMAKNLLPIPLSSLFEFNTDTRTCGHSLKLVHRCHWTSESDDIFEVRKSD